MEDKFSPQESLLLIQSMIEKTKDNISRNRFTFLFWGWLIFITTATQFVLKVMIEYKYHYLVWLSIYMAPAYLAFGRRRMRLAYSTYVGDSMRYLGIGLSITFMILSLLIFKIGVEVIWPISLLLYGLGTFVSGKILQFRPLVIGGFINWALACVATFVSYDYQLLIGAVAIMTTYVIPGYLIKPTTK